MTGSPLLSLEMFVLALPTTGFRKEVTFSFPQELQAIDSPIRRHSFVKMC